MNLPPYTVFPSLACEEVTLREIQCSDLGYIINISYYDSIQAQNIRHAQKMQNKIQNDYEQGNSIHWGIIENLNKTIVGTCGYYRGFKKGEGELGCVLLPEFRGRGYMVSAMKLAINFGKNHMHLKRIWAVTSKDNNPALRLLERLNFQIANDHRLEEVELELI